jgi:hypothetical protein
MSLAKMNDEQRETLTLFARDLAREVHTLATADLSAQPQLVSQQPHNLAAAERAR